LDAVVLLYLIIIPVIFIFLIVYIVDFSKKSKMQEIMIDALSSQNSKLIEQNRVKKVENSEKKEKSWLTKNLHYAGFFDEKSELVFLSICVVFGFISGFFIFTAVGSPIVFVVSSALMGFIPVLILVKIIKTREEDFNLHLKEIIDKVTNMMRSGVGFEQSLKKSILTTNSAFTKQVFSIYLNEKSVIGEDKAFNKMFEYVESRELRIFYLIIKIGKQSGGKFSNTLETLRRTLQDQGELKQQITSSTREVKIGSYMIISIIVFIYFLMNESMNNILNDYFFGTEEGKIQMFFIVLWVILGLYVNNLLTKIK
jgi:tight adherence protein B